MVKGLKTTIILASIILGICLVISSFLIYSGMYKISRNMPSENLTLEGGGYFETIKIEHSGKIEHGGYIDIYITD